MNRTLKLAIVLALATGGGQVWAQNLGPVQMRSTMEQPLVAEIPLTGVSGSLDRIHVALASEEAFSRAGLNRGGLPVELSFAVAKNGSGQPVIRITSSSPVRDTYLDFLVEVSSGSNSVVREVTMLLDPPGTPIGSMASGGSVAAAPAARPSRTSDVPARVPAATEPRPTRSESPAPAAPVAPAPRRAASPATAPAAAQPATAEGKVGPIQRGQTLSTIAREHANGAQMSQMLVALQKANPDAFYRDNINALKTGAVLRIPSAADVQAETASSALVEVRRQNDAWRNGTARAPASVADAASSGAPQATGKAATPASDRLALVPSKAGGEGASARAGTKDGTGTAQVAGLKQDLSNSQEAVASLKQQGDELKSRIGDLEDINTKNQRLLSLKDSEIADLQRKLADSRKAAASPAVASSAAKAPAVAGGVATPAVAGVNAGSAPAAASTAGKSTASVAGASTVGATNASAAAPAAGATVASAAPTPVAGATVAATPPGAPAAAGTAAHPMAATGAAASVAKPGAPARAPITPVDEEDPWYMQPWAWGAGGVVVLLLLVAAVFGRRKEKEATVTTASLADRFNQEPNFDTFEPMGHTDEIDQDQREILDALAEHPDDVGLHLELVSLYYGRRDVDHFEAAAEAMHAHVADEDQPEWREVVMMGEDLAPSHPLFGGELDDGREEPYDDVYVPSTPHDVHEAAALEEFDLGTYVTGPGEDEAAVVEPQKHSEYHFNFDLTPVERAEADSRPNAPDVFDVDAPESPYIEAAHHESAHQEAGEHAAFGDILAEETAHVTPVEERSTWAFDDERDTAVADTDEDRFKRDVERFEHEPAPLADEETPFERDPFASDAIPFDHADVVSGDTYVPPLPQETILRHDEPLFPDEEPIVDHTPDSFSDDPVDTKLDLARAYLDMGDEEGARLMLDEVISEGTQMQKDTATRILDGIV